MKGKNHLFIGIGSAVALVAATKPETIPVGICIIGATAVGSLFPDIDNAKSKISKRLKITSKIVNKAFGHRGFVHSPLCMAIIYLTAILIFKKYEISGYPYLHGFLTGYAGHLFADMTTRGGIPLFYPLKTKISLTQLKSGGKFEFVVAIIVLLIIALGIFAITYFFSR